MKKKRIKKKVTKQMKFGEMKEEKNHLQQIFFVLLIIIAFALLLYPRTVPFISMNLGKSILDKPYLSDPDSCYHVRRMIYIAQHKLKLPFLDQLIAHPEGAVPIWSPLYDWISAFPSFILGGGSPSDKMVITIARWLSPLFCIIELLFISLFVFKCTKNSYIALLASFLVGLTGKQILYTTINMLDHNSLLMALFAALIYCNSLMLEKENIKLLDNIILINSLICAALFWTWPGSYIYTFAIAAIQFVYIIISKKIFHFKTVALFYFYSSILILPLSLLHFFIAKEIFRFEYVSFLTLLVFLGIAFFNLAVYYGVLFQNGYKKRGTILKMICAAVLFIVFMIISINPLLEGLSYARAQNKWLSAIMESKPLFYLTMGPLKAFTTDKAIFSFGYMIFVFPILLILLLIRVIKTSLQLSITIIITGLIYGSLSLNQYKFALEAAIPIGIIVAVAAESLYKKVASYNNIVAICITTLALIGIAYPLHKQLRPDLRNAFNLFPEAFAWLKNDSKLPEVVINEKVEGIEKSLQGVMAPWDIGHHIKLYSNMPTVADNFGFLYMTINQWQGFYDMARFFLTDNEQEAIRILKQYKCEYVVIGTSSAFEPYPMILNANPKLYFDYRIWHSPEEGPMLMVQPKEKFMASIAFRLAELYGSANPAPNEGMMHFAALRHFRLVYELPAKISLDGMKIPPGALKIYKYVVGANFEVPGIPKDSNLPYRVEGIIVTNAGNRFFYRQYGLFNDKIIVPYPTERNTNYPHAEYYYVFINNMRYEFSDVSESEVLYGTIR